MITYPKIDYINTGVNIRRLCDMHSTPPSCLIEYLNLTDVASCYHWFHGSSLPTVPHLYALAVLWNIHMDEIIIPEEPNILSDIRSL